VRAEFGGELGSVKLFFKMAKIMWFSGFLVAKIFMIQKMSPYFSIGF
jgi:hypothetical protein